MISEKRFSKYNHRQSLRFVAFSVAVIMVFGILTPFVVKSQTQAEMTQSASADYKKADAELNRIYKKLMQVYKADDAESIPVREAIIKSKQAWIKYRDLSVQVVLKMYSGGSMAPMQATGHMAELTRYQTLTLRQYLRDDDADAPPVKQ